MAMESLNALLFDIGPYHWLALAALLIAIEMVMPTQYLMWPGIAAAAVGLLGFVADLSVAVEVGIFALLSAVLVAVSHYYAPKTVAREGGSLNQRTDQMVGRTAIVALDFQNGQGAVTVGDTRWSAQAVDGSDFPIGTRVEIVAAESTLLKVKRV
jgi:inner membrane protein